MATVAAEPIQGGEPFMAGVGGTFVGGKEPFMEQPTLTTRPTPWLPTPLIYLDSHSSADYQLAGYSRKPFEARGVGWAIGYRKGTHSSQISPSHVSPSILVYTEFTSVPLSLSRPLCGVEGHLEMRVTGRGPIRPPSSGTGSSIPATVRV